MKEKKKRKGGKRAGAGRKPSGRQKEAVTVYVDTSKFGGKAGARKAIYGFYDGERLPDSEKKFPPPDREIKQKTPKEEKKPPVADLKPQEQHKSVGVTQATGFPAPSLETFPVRQIHNGEIEKQIAEIKAEKIPKERDTVYGRKSWQLDQERRIQELKNQLK